MHGTVIKSFDTFINLGVIRSPDGSYAAHHSGLIAARKAVDLVYRSFRSRKKRLLWPAFQAYVIPIGLLMYCSSA